jgi:hypothetical protein
MDDALIDWESREQPATILGNIEWGWIALTWLIAAASTVVVSAIVLGLISLVGSDPFQSARTHVDAVPLATGFLSFPTFLLVLNLRLIRALQHERLLHSLLVAIAHIVVLLAVLGVALVLRGSSDFDFTQILPGTTLDEIGVGFFSLERSAAAVIGAALIAPSLVPQTGRPPRGTQVGHTSEDQML